MKRRRRPHILITFPAGPKDEIDVALQFNDDISEETKDTIGELMCIMSEHIYRLICQDMDGDEAYSEPTEADFIDTQNVRDALKH